MNHQSLFACLGLKTLFNKLQNAVLPSTRRKYLNELERKVDAKLEKQRKTNLLIQKKNERKPKRLQRQRDAVLKRQSKLDRERKRQDVKFKKLRKEQELSSRLLIPEEKISLLNRIDTEPLFDAERSEISQKFMDDKAERRRRKKRLRQQGRKFETLRNVES